VYSEVMEIAQSLDGRLPRGMDREDYDDESHEREQRARMNAEFASFTKKVEDMVSSSFAPSICFSACSTIDWC